MQCSLSMDSTALETCPLVGEPRCELPGAHGTQSRESLLLLTGGVGRVDVLHEPEFQEHGARCLLCRVLPLGRHCEHLGVSPDRAGLDTLNQCLVPLGQILLLLLCPLASCCALCRWLGVENCGSIESLEIELEGAADLLDVVLAQHCVVVHVLGRQDAAAHRR